MSTVSGALIHIKGDAQVAPGSPYEGEIRSLLENVSGGRRYTNGTGSGQVNTVYYRNRTATGDGTLGAGGTDSYNLLAAGALTDVFGATVDMDELKMLVVVVDSGAIKIDAPAANAIPIFADPTDVILLASVKCIALDFGAAGLDVTTNSKFDIIETSGATAAGYYLLAIGAS